MYRRQRWIAWMPWLPGPASHGRHPSSQMHPQAVAVLMTAAASCCSRCLPARRLPARRLPAVTQQQRSCAADLAACWTAAGRSCSGHSGSWRQHRGQRLLRRSLQMQMQRRRWLELRRRQQRASAVPCLQPCCCLCRTVGPHWQRQKQQWRQRPAVPAVAAEAVPALLRGPLVRRHRLLAVWSLSPSQHRKQPCCLLAWHPQMQLIGSSLWLCRRQPQLISWRLWQQQRWRRRRLQQQPLHHLQQMGPWLLDGRCSGHRRRLLLQRACPSSCLASLSGSCHPLAATAAGSWGGLHPTLQLHSWELQ